MLKFHKFKLPKNTRYNYSPRYYEGKDVGNIYDFESKFEKYKNTPNSIDFGAHWKEDRKASRHRGNRSINRRVIIIFMILLFIFLWLIDFDLSIFSNAYAF